MVVAWARWKVANGLKLGFPGAVNRPYEWVRGQGEERGEDDRGLDETLCQ